MPSARGLFFHCGIMVGTMDLSESAQDNPQAVRILFSEVRSKVEGQAKRRDAHRAKAGMLLASTAFLFAAVVAVFIRIDQTSYSGDY